jgi:predicted metal-binding protein
MKSVDSPVSTALILVCDRCGKRMKADLDKNPSRQLVSRLKHRSRDEFEKGEIRAALTSCLDICPRDRLTVAVVATHGSASQPLFFTVKADDIDDTSRQILKEVHKAVGIARKGNQD